MNKSVNVLLAEDDPSLGTLLSEYLELKGYSVSLCQDGVEAKGHIENGIDAYDIAILDVMMPQLDGFAVAELLRERSDMPMIFLTARSDKDDKLHGFKIGADDYVTKPFSMEELLCRIQALLRRSSQVAEVVQDAYQFGHFDFVVAEQSLQSPSGSRSLSTRESEIMHLLCANMNKVVARSTILQKLWGDDSYFNSRSLDVFISRLRKHLKTDDSVKIVSVHGKGYRLVTTE